MDKCSICYAYDLKTILYITYVIITYDLNNMPILYAYTAYIIFSTKCTKTFLHVLDITGYI